MQKLLVSVVFMSCLGLLAHAADDLGALMPETVAHYQRIALVTGKAAQDEVDKLHGKPLPAEASAVARYARKDETVKSAEVWVSRVESEREARRQLGVMVHMMYENPHSPFKNPSRLDHNDTAVYRFTGMGQAHVMWYSDDLVYWISVAPQDQSVMLDAFVK